MKQKLEQEMDRYFETMEVLEHENIFESTFQKIAEHFYEFGRKQDELTWQDVKQIVNIADSKLTHTAWDDINYPDEQKYYEEVLKEFNNLKNKEI